jgi:hypothetical protein
MVEDNQLIGSTLVKMNVRITTQIAKEVSKRTVEFLQ